MKKIGILGGTFNPIHLEHAALARAAIKELNLDKLVVMPTFISPHKDRSPAPAQDRLNMLKLAFSDDDRIEVSDYEIQKQGKSYTYLTVEHFKEKDNAEIFFICGGDMLTNFKTWRYPERILSACTLAVFARDDFFTDFESEREYFKRTFGKEYIKLNYVGKNMSSTKIRVYSLFSLSLEGQVDKCIEEYIKKNALYRGDSRIEYVKAALTQKRLKHTANVVVVALKKVKELGLDEEKVTLACALHDVAKYLSPESVEGFVMDEKMPKPVVHAFLGAFVAEHILKVDDAEVIDAIRYHTSGKAGMSTLAKLVFVADMIEEDRDYDGVDKLRACYENEEFEKCFCECLKEEWIHLQNKKSDIFAETENAYRYYIENKKEG